MFRILRWFILSAMLLVVLLVSLIASGIKIIRGMDIKNRALGTYQTVIRKIGDKTLTSNSELKGQRIFGEDHFVGTYTVNYRKNTGTEKIFGGCILEREAGGTVHIMVSIENSVGEIEVIVKEKEKSHTLATKDGTYTYDLDVQYGSNYLIIQTKDYSGNVKVESK